MALHFAAPFLADASTLRGGAACRAPANDNGGPCLQDPLVREALRHFAVHGLGAAQVAESLSTAAFHGGEHGASCRWSEIRQLLGAGSVPMREAPPLPAP